MLLALLPLLLFALACNGNTDPAPTPTASAPAPPAAASATPGNGAAAEATPTLEAAAGGSAQPTPTAVARAPPTAVPAAPSATPGSAAPTATLEAPVAAVADGQRIFERVRVLSETIGARPSGTAKEQAAIDYISGQLRGFGYDVEIQEFSIATQSGRASSLSVRSPSQRTIPTVPFAFSGAGNVRAALFAAGLGSSTEFPVAAAGAVVLIERGDLFFNDKVANAEAAGALGAIIFNNERGTFFGTLQAGFTIPVVAISQAEGQALLATLAAGPVEVELSVSAAGESVAYNIIARPPGRDCETVSGGHYDSVPQAPGASDNASGTATVIEIAGLLAQSGSSANNCFVLFGAEELGLVGSRAFVSSLDSQERGRLKAMFNYDMVGVGTQGWLLIGNPDLQQRGAALAATLGISVQPGGLPSSTTSDHASFLAAAIPALMLHRINDPLLHTPQDVLSRIQPNLLEDAARLGVALLESLNEG